MENMQFSWVETHKQLTEYLSYQENNQQDLIELLKSVGIGPFKDKDQPGSENIDLDEIDPFTFFFYIYKYHSKRRLRFLQKIAEKLDLVIPSDDGGIPSAQAQQVWLFPYKYDRTNNEIQRLWDFFKKAISNQISDDDFQDVLQIKCTGKTKITEALFNIDPENFFPVNGPTKPYLKEVFKIDPNFNNFSEYLNILKQIKTKTDVPFYELSYEAWKWNDKQKNVLEKEENKNYKKEFLKWLKSNSPLKSGKPSSYVKAIDILSKILNKELFKTTDDGFLRNLYDDLLKEQGDLKGKYHYKKAPSYGEYKFYSAAIDSYRKFLRTIMVVSKQNNDQMNFPLNTILYGPPGTGKTYNTVLRAAEIIENRKIESYNEALEIFKKNLHNQIEFITFHQNYSYEDFIQGLRPDTENDKELTFERKDGVFKIIADRALKNIQASEKPPVAKKPFEETFNEFVNPLVEGEVEEIEVQMKKVSYFITAVTNKSIDFRKASGGTQHTLSITTLRRMYEAESVLDIQGLSSYYSPLLDKLLKLGKDSTAKKEAVIRKNYVIIIDEINRANISRVFGELITLIEPDKRSHGKIPMEARLPSGEPFMVPSNLYIIGTMNTADKSIALLDIALRRRFEFESIYPKYEINGEEIYDVDILRNINTQIIKSKGHDFQIGHSYFMGENKDFIKRMNMKVIPLLLEYYMNDDKEVKGILKTAGVEVEENSWPLKATGKND